MPNLAKMRTWAEIDLSALRHNLSLARQTAGVPLMGVVKAGAYGHGFELVAREMEMAGIAFFGVANIGEARRLSLAGCKTPIYLLGPTFAAEREEVVVNQWIPSLSTLEEARDFSRLACQHQKQIRVHLTLDTGMGRGGFLPSRFADATDIISALPGLKLEGVGSHMPVADEDRDFTLSQIESFNRSVEAAGGEQRFRWRHLANSAGILGYQIPACNLARPGLFVYGINSMPGATPDLRPVLTLKSRITLIRELPPGHGVSYGRTFVTARPSRIATVGIGYGDGYPRQLSGKGARVFIHGAFCPVLGRVTMDQIMVDVTDCPAAEAGDEVELLGSNISVDEIARLSDTISWDIFTGIGSRVARIPVTD